METFIHQNLPLDPEMKKDFDGSEGVEIDVTEPSCPFKVAANSILTVSGDFSIT